VVLNSAGVAGGGMVHMLEEDAWDHVMDINMKGTFLVNKHVVPVMMEGGGGSVINVASVEGIEGFMGGSVYNASKGAVILLTKNMSIDYASAGIRVNAICPGFVDTPLLRATFRIEGAKALEDQIRAAHQLGRFGKPVELANAALFLASDESSFVTGVALPVDGGYLAGHRFTG
jgi:NAD(P)-dependent dehydrogenase (short-subunit alcohol dehydrogenase family)